MYYHQIPHQRINEMMIRSELGPWMMQGFPDGEHKGKKTAIFQNYNDFIPLTHVTPEDI